MMDENACAYLQSESYWQLFSYGRNSAVRITLFFFVKRIRNSFIQESLKWLVILNNHQTGSIVSLLF